MKRELIRKGINDTYDKYSDLMDKEREVDINISKKLRHTNRGTSARILFVLLFGLIIVGIYNAYLITNPRIGDVMVYYLDDPDTKELDGWIIVNHSQGEKIDGITSATIVGEIDGNFFDLRAQNQ